MLLDRTHATWASAAVLLAAGSVVLYLWDAPHHPAGPSGSTWMGLTFGSVALALMVFASALSLKRRVPHWPIGRAQTWLRGHIWMGLLAVLLVALHSAFHLGGPMAMSLWGLLGIVTISGLFGLVLQQFVPRLLLHAVPGETIAQQIDRTLNDLSTQADEVFESLNAAAGEADRDVIESVRVFYHEQLRPHLAGVREVAALATERQADSMFAALRTRTPSSLHTSIGELEQLTRRRRQIRRQRRLMRVLFAWLLIHVPVSWLLLVAVIAHALIALRFKT